MRIGLATVVLRLQRKLSDALQYPMFILLAATAVLLFFILFVLPQFSAVLRDFNAKTDGVVTIFLNLSDLLRAHGPEFGIGSAIVIVGGWLLLRRPEVRSTILAEISRVPGISAVFNFYRTALFCRNLSILLGSDVTLSATLRILVDIMAVSGKRAPWVATSDRVRHGGGLLFDFPDRNQDFRFEPDATQIDAQFGSNRASSRSRRTRRL